MVFRNVAFAAAAASAVAGPMTAWAFVGGPGCTNLPLYNRALGALQGMTSACDMSVEEARRIIAEHDRPALAPAAPPETAPSRPPRHPRRRPEPPR